MSKYILLAIRDGLKYLAIFALVVAVILFFGWVLGRYPEIVFSVIGVVCAAGWVFHRAIVLQDRDR